jgi:dihydroorotate dehydrogenase (fumarate)
MALPGRGPGGPRAIGIPLAVKLSPYFSSLTNMAGQLVEAGADGLVLFNRFYQPDLDIEAMEVAAGAGAEHLGRAAPAAALDRHPAPAPPGVAGRLDRVHTATDVLKVLLAGADVAMMTSALLPQRPRPPAPARGAGARLDGPPRLRDRRPAPGRLSQRSVPNPAAFERANYIKTLASHAASG